MFGTEASVAAFLDRELSVGSARADVEAWIEAGTANGTFALFQLPGQPPQHLAFSNATAVPVPGDSSVCRRPRFMATLLFESDRYAGHAIADVSLRVPAGDARRYFGDDVEVRAFMDAQFPPGIDLDEAQRRAQALAEKLPDLAIVTNDATLVLRWTGASAQRGFMTADGVRMGYQALQCSTTLQFDGARVLVGAEHTAFLTP